MHAAPTLTEPALDIRVAVAGDAGTVARLAAACQLRPDTDTSTGFLLYAVSEAEYGALMAAPMTLIAQRDGEAVGFVLGAWFDGSLEAQALGATNTGALLIGQVGVLPAYRGTGVGRALYETLSARYAQRALVATVSLAPHLNSASVAFHTQLRFEAVGELHGPDGYQVLVFVRPPSARP